MEVDVPSDTTTRRVTVPNHARLVRSRPLAPLPAAWATFDAALRADLVEGERIVLACGSYLRPHTSTDLLPGGAWVGQG